MSSGAIHSARRDTPACSRLRLPGHAARRRRAKMVKIITATTRPTSATSVIVFAKCLKTRFSIVLLFYQCVLKRAKQNQCSFYRNYLTKLAVQDKDDFTYHAA